VVFYFRLYFFLFFFFFFCFMNRTRRFGIVGSGWAKVWRRAGTANGSYRGTAVADVTSRLGMSWTGVTGRRNIWPEPTGRVKIAHGQNGRWQLVPSRRRVRRRRHERRLRHQKVFMSVRNTWKTILRYRFGRIKPMSCTHCAWSCAYHSVRKYYYIYV
jgi:hypothetical protein